MIERAERIVVQKKLDSIDSNARQKQQWECNSVNSAVVKSVGNAIFGGGGGGSCYITTATCEEYGKSDNCYELTMFRSFRDT